MIELMFFSIVLTVLLGLVAKLVLDRINKADYLITWREFMLVVGVCCFVITPLVTFVGWELAKRSKVSYNEYQNGWENATRIDETICHKNGACRYTYSCDPHLVPYSCNCKKDGGCDTCWRTEYDSCPYCTHEYDYVVITTLGSYTIDSHRFPVNPQEHRWREHETIPDSEIQRAGVGEPPFWTAVNNRIKAERPGWVTKVGVYRNLIYASESNILKQYSSAIQRYMALGLLPQLSTGVRSFYLTDKVYFVGVTIPDKDVWNDRLGYLDAAIGRELQGDLHLILADAAKITNPDEFVLAVKAFWTDALLYGRNVLSKNAIVIVLGTDGKTVLWAKGFTGMPVGNDAMITALASLKGQELTADKIIGKVERVKKGPGEYTLHSSGSLESIIFGFGDKATKFKRVHMESFGYLMNEIEPNTTDKIICLIINILLGCIGWAVVIFGDIL
jgi:hypothetical protein